MSDVTIALDVSKDSLDAHRLPGDECRRFDNKPSGFKALIRWIGPKPTRVVFEPTGPYHRELERALAAAGMPIVKVNPRSARRFAQAIHQFAKTDALDAAMLARMGAMLGIEPRPVRDAILNDLKDLHVAREALVKDRTAATNRARTASLALLKRLAEARLRQIEQQLDAIDTEIMALIQANPVLAERFAIVRSIPGIGQITAAMLVTEMPELGNLDPKQAAALAGLAPMTRQSGKWTGKAFIQGGRKHVRRALYMPALVAMRFNPDLKRTYQRLINAGKAAKQAITAVMRKLVVLANALLRKQSFWQQRTP